MFITGGNTSTEVLLNTNKLQYNYYRLTYFVFSTELRVGSFILQLTMVLIKSPSGSRVDTKFWSVHLAESLAFYIL